MTLRAIFLFLLPCALFGQVAQFDLRSDFVSGLTTTLTTIDLERITPSKPPYVSPEGYFSNRIRITAPDFANVTDGQLTVQNPWKYQFVDLGTGSVLVRQPTTGWSPGRVSRNYCRVKSVVGGAVTL